MDLGFPTAEMFHLDSPRMPPERLGNTRWFRIFPTLAVTPASPPCLATVSFREPQFSKHWYREGSKSNLTVWGSSSWAWVSLLLTTC